MFIVEERMSPAPDPWKAPDGFERYSGPIKVVPNFDDHTVTLELSVAARTVILDELDLSILLSSLYEAQRAISDRVEIEPDYE